MIGDRTDLVPLVAGYAAAKSAQDVAAALAVCDDAFVLDTPTFGTRSPGKAATAAQLHAFFAAFPADRMAATLAGLRGEPTGRAEVHP